MEDIKRQLQAFGRKEGVGDYGGVLSDAFTDGFGADGGNKMGKRRSF